MKRRQDVIRRNFIGVFIIIIAAAFYGTSLIFAQTGSTDISANGQSDTIGNVASSTQLSGTPASTTLKAEFIDKESKAAKQTATVKVEVQGIEIVDPASVQEKPNPAQGHLHYQVDNGPVIATTAEKLSFHGLTKGNHTITVTLAGNDHQPLGPQEKLSVDIP